MFRCGEQGSPIFEGVTEIRINSQPCKGINLTTWHTEARRAPRVATVHDLVPSSMRMPQWTHRGCPEYYPVVHRWSNVMYHPAMRHTMLLILRDPMNHVIVGWVPIFWEVQSKSIGGDLDIVDEGSEQCRFKPVQSLHHGSVGYQPVRTRIGLTKKAMS
jgi:hypothetical protein